VRFCFVRNGRSASALFCFTYIFIITYIDNDHIYKNSCPCLQFSLHIATVPCSTTFMPCSKYVCYSYINKYSPKCCVSYMSKNFLKCYGIQFFITVVRSDLLLWATSRNVIKIYGGTVIYWRKVTRTLK